VSAVAVASVAATVAWLFHRAYPQAHSQTVSITRPDRDPDLARVVMTGPMSRPRDFFRPINRPRYLSIEDADTLMSEDEVVLGLVFGGKYLAYPINLLNEHEMVREEIGGTPLLITW